MDRLDDLIRFYELLDRLEEKASGKRTLANCNGLMDWPQRGVYFFFEPGEERSNSGAGLRVVRVGTHALKDGSRTTLWKRLSQHRGIASTGSGNHRGSIFRLLVGAAIKGRGQFREVESWGVGADLSAAARKLGSNRDDIREKEQDLEAAVSDYISKMPFLWLKIDDPSGKESDRGVIERNSIALLSNYNSDNPFDPSSTDWLGKHCNREKVRKSGIWNNNHVEEGCDSRFLTRMEGFVSAMQG